MSCNFVASHLSPSSSPAQHDKAKGCGHEPFDTIGSVRARARANVISAAWHRLMMTMKIIEKIDDVWPACVRKNQQVNKQK